MYSAHDATFIGTGIIFLFVSLGLLLLSKEHQLTAILAVSSGLAILAGMSGMGLAVSWIIFIGFTIAAVVQIARLLLDFFAKAFHRGK